MGADGDIEFVDNDKAIKLKPGTYRVTFTSAVKYSANQGNFAEISMITVDGTGFTEIGAVLNSDNLFNKVGTNLNTEYRETRTFMIQPTAEYTYYAFKVGGNIDDLERVSADTTLIIQRLE